MRLEKARAWHLSSVTGIVRPEIYRILHELSSEGLVERTPGAPSTYTAISPDRGLSLIIDRRRKELIDLEKKKADLMKVLGTYPRREKLVFGEGFSAIMRADNVILLAKQMISEAKHEYAAIMSKFALKRVKEYGVMRTIISAKNRNVRVRIISEIDESNSLAAKALSKHVELKESHEILFYIDIFDRKEILFGPAITDEELSNYPRGEVDLYTNNPRFVSGMCALFERLWDASARFG